MGKWVIHLFTMKSMWYDLENMLTYKFDNSYIKSNIKTKNLKLIKIEMFKLQLNQVNKIRKLTIMFTQFIIFNIFIESYKFDLNGKSI